MSTLSQRVAELETSVAALQTSVNAGFDSVRHALAARQRTADVLRLVAAFLGGLAASVSPELAVKAAAALASQAGGP
jgi:hypothetical protein